MKEPATEAIKRALSGPEPVTVDEICQAVWGRVGDRERNQVYQLLHRLREKGELKTWERRYQRTTSR